MTSCTSPALHHPPPVVFVLPLIPELASAKAEGGLATVGTLRVHLKGGSVDLPDEGVAGWFATSFGVFKKQTEKYTVREFLEKYSRFLSDTSLRNMLLIEIDYATVYYDKTQANPDDLQTAVKAANEYLAKHPTDTNKIVLSAVGRTNKGLRHDLQLQVEAQFLRKHGYGKPSIEIDVVGIPSAFLKQDRETQQEYDARLGQLTRELEDNAREAEIRRGHEETMNALLADYQQHLAGMFEIDKATKKVATRPEMYAD